MWNGAQWQKALMNNADLLLEDYDNQNESNANDDGITYY